MVLQRNGTLPKLPKGDCLLLPLWQVSMLLDVAISESLIQFITTIAQTMGPEASTSTSTVMSTSSVSLLHKVSMSLTWLRAWRHSRQEAG